MPGVPTGRACEGCRKQKKKCDEKIPSCSRCTRLRIACIGSGQQKFIFKPQQPKTETQGSTSRKLVSHKVGGVAEAGISAAPISKVTLLAQSFLETIKPSTSLRYNLAWTYGVFLEDVPRRLGVNEALDTSVDALVCAHSQICLGQKASVEALTKYSLALMTLRIYLDSPITAQASETLCAVMILLICQGFIGLGGNTFTAHSEGAAQILKARRFYNHEDEFECKLVASLRGPVLFESVLYNKIHLTPSEWKSLVENKIDDITSEGKMMRCLARVPEFMERGRKVLRGGYQDMTLIEETRTNYIKFKAILQEVQIRLKKSETSDIILIPGSTITLHTYYQRIYAFILSVGIILNSVLSAIDIENGEFAAESERFAVEIVALAVPEAQNRPLWSSYMVFCLMAAWIGTMNASIRLLVERAIEDYQQDFPNGQIGMVFARPFLEKIWRQLHLLDVNDIEIYFDNL